MISEVGITHVNKDELLKVLEDVMLSAILCWPSYFLKVGTKQFQTLVVAEHNFRWVGFLNICRLLLILLNHKDGIALGVQNREKLFRLLLRLLELEKSEEFPVLQDVEQSNYDESIDGYAGCEVDKGRVLEVTILPFEVDQCWSKRGNIAKKEKSDWGCQQHAANCEVLQNDEAPAFDQYEDLLRVIRRSNLHFCCEDKKGVHRSSVHN